MPTISLNIDLVPSLLLISAAIAVLTPAVARRAREQQASLVVWAGGCVLVALGLLLIVLGPLLPAAMAILAANLAIVSGYTLLGVGTALYLNKSPGLDIAAGAAFGLAFALAYAGAADIAIRVAIISSAMLFFGTHLALRFHRASPLPPHRLAVAALGSTALLGFLRLLDVMFGLPDWIGNSQLHGLTLGLGVTATAALATALVVLGWRAMRPRTESGDGAGAADADIWRLDVSRSMLTTPSGGELKLTAAERIALQTLTRTDQSVPRVDLIAAIGRDTENPKDRSIDVLISRLRRKSAEAGTPLPVSSIRGHGYIFSGALREV